MADGDSLGQIFNPATGVWALVAMAAVTLFKVWPFILERLNEHHRDTVAEKAGDWTRLRDENERLHLQLAECEKVRVEWMRRAITAEATLQGYGNAIQQAQVIVSAERLVEVKKPEASDE